VGERSGQQLRLAGVGGRIGRRHGEAVRHSRERQPTCVNHPIHSGFDADTNANGNSYPDPDSNGDSYTDPNAYGDSYPDTYTYSHSYSDPNTYSYS